MTDTLPPAETPVSAGQQLYEFLAARGHKPRPWPAWEHLTAEQHAILTIWAAQFRTAVEVLCST